jgi:hypothetical protein
MNYPNAVELANQEAVEFNRYSIRLWIVLSLILSLATIFILSKESFANDRWMYAAGLVLPLSVTLYFRKSIVWFGPFAYVAALVLMLSAAVYFGI